MSWSERLRRRVTTLVSSHLGAEGGSRNINVVDPSNVVVSTNVGESSSRHYSSSSQTVRVRQRDAEVVDTDHHEVDRRDGGQT